MSGSSISTFITMFDQFLSELNDSFPDHKKIQSYYTKFDLLKKTNPRSILNMFVEHTKPYATAIMDKDESLFMNDEVPLIVELQLKKLWTDESTSAATKDAIWAHLSSLYFFASTISSIPDGLMENIESLAKQYASEMDDSTAMDPTMLMKSMSNMQSMLSGLQKKSK
jgi:hypothetical protein